MNRFISTEPEKCIGCRTCEIACVIAHAPDHSVEHLSPANFKPRLQLIKTKGISAMATCHHCENAPCVNACPSKAIDYIQGTVQVNQGRCFGCKNCEIVCPFGAMEVLAHPAHTVVAGIEMNSGITSEAHKCDLCMGRPGGPACVEVCPTKALHVVDRSKLGDTRAQLQQRSVANMGALHAPPV